MVPRRSLSARRSLSQLATTVVGSAGFAGTVSLLERIDHRSPHLLTVLMYHRIDDHHRAPELDPSIISTTPGEFERQVEYLAERRPVLSLADALAVRRGERPLPPGAVMVTFDDAYRDFADHAWPVLRRAGVPVTLFVPTAYPDRPDRAFWWDRVHAAFTATERRGTVDTAAGRLAIDDPEQRTAAARRFIAWIKVTPHDDAMAGVDRLVEELEAPPLTGSVLGWDELRALSADGVTLAPHTQTHPLLNRVSLARARAEVAGSTSDLHREIGAAPAAFAFPAGGYTPELVHLLSETGYEMAFTCDRGGNDLRTSDWLQLRRINVGRRSSLPVIQAQLLSWVVRGGRRRPTRARA